MSEWTSEVEKKVVSHHDRVLEDTTQRVLNNLGPQLFRFIEDPYCPEPLRSWNRHVYDRVWTEVQSELLDETMRSFGRQSLYSQTRAGLLDHWPTTPALFKCGSPRYSCGRAVMHFFWVLRARFLYADQPADGSAWKVLGDPLGLLIFVCKLHYATSVATFGLVFLLMDRRDEAQLVQFILKFKSVMFLTAGLLPAATLGFTAHACLHSVDEGDPAACLRDAPSSSAYFSLSSASELLRLLFIYLAFILLACGHAVGGEQEIAALQYTRLHAADDDEPHAAAKVAPAALASPTGGSTAAGSTSSTAPLRKAPSASGPDAAAAGAADPLTMASPRVYDPSVLAAQLEAQRSSWGAERRVGGALPYFLLYDVCVLILLVLAWLVLYVWPRACAGEYVWPLALTNSSWRLPSALADEGYVPVPAWTGFGECEGLDVSSPLFASSLYNLKMVYGLLMLPFLVFQVPLIGEALTKTCPTAYDQTGRLVVKLGKYTVHELCERRHEPPGAKSKTPSKGGGTTGSSTTAAMSPGPAADPVEAAAVAAMEQRAAAPLPADLHA